MGNDHYNEDGKSEIEKGCLIKNAICDKNVIIGENSRLTNDRKVQEYESEEYVIKNGIIVIPPHTKIPPNSVI